MIDKAQIWHNKNERESFFRGWDPEDHMELRWEGPLHRSWKNDQMNQAVLEVVFDSNQHVDAKHRPWYEGRSLSVGDVIVLDDQAYAIERVGFKEIEWTH